MTPDELLDSIRHGGDFAQTLVDAWPEIAACLERLAVAEADAEDLAEDLASAEAQWSHDPLWKKWGLSDSLLARRARLYDEAARRSQP